MVDVHTNEEAINSERARSIKFKIKMTSIFAVLVDADNIPATVMGKALDILKTRGRIVICKVFGDFSRQALAPWKQSCLTYNLEAIMAWHKSGKNSSDLKLCQACTHMLYSHPAIKDYVLVTGDGDFTTVIQDLKTHDKNVICMGIEEQCSVVLKNCCDEFISLRVKKRTVGSKTTITIKDAIECEFRNSDDPRLNCGSLKERLLRINPAYTEVNYNQPSFGKLLQHLGYDVFHNTGGTPFVKKK
jgi:uncharacterized protein (TIGR00288 family)